MDAGLAAVIAGAAGAGGAALAAFATSLGLLRQAKLQGNQAHRSWLRDHQQQAFEEFLVAAEAMQAACRDTRAAAHASEASSHSSEQRENVNSHFEDLFRRNRALTEVVQRVALLANEPTSEAALNLVGAMIDVVEVLHDSRTRVSPSDPESSARYEQAEGKVSELQGRFLNEARTSLQQD